MVIIDAQYNRLIAVLICVVGAFIAHKEADDEAKV